MLAQLSLAAALTVAQLQTAIVPTGSNLTPPKGPPSEAVSDDSAEEIASDAARDLKDTRFYNRPGATRAQYNADWQECRLIARGSRSPSGMVTYVYNPAVISPLAAGVGAGIGAAIGEAIRVGKLRRANRRQCLLIHGWRLVETPPSEEARITAMSDVERDAFFNTIVGAQTLEGMKVKVWNNDFAAPKLAPEAQ